LLAAKERIEGQVFNIGYGKDYSIGEIAEIAGSIKGIRPKIQVVPSRLRPYDVTRLVCDNTKVVNLTGWKPETGLEEGLRKTIEWYEKNGCTWEWERRYAYTSGETDDERFPRGKTRLRIRS
jgi:nucleoside-diphosphate-sugar epimerase